MSSDPISCKRYYARLKREREYQRAINRDATISRVPFPDWLRKVHGVTDWHDLKRYDLWSYYLDYRADCAGSNMPFDHASLYGLTRV